MATRVRAASTIALGWHTLPIQHSTAITQRKKKREKMKGKKVRREGRQKKSSNEENNDRKKTYRGYIGGKEVVGERPQR